MIPLPRFCLPEGHRMSGCLTCHLLGRWQHGPLYWLNRAHLHYQGRLLDSRR